MTLEEFVRFYHPQVLEEYLSLNSIYEDWEAAFNEFWEVYDKKTGKHKCKLKFKAIPKAKWGEVIEHAGKYKDATPDRQFRMNPLTYLNGHYYEEEETITAALERNKPTTKESGAAERAVENLKGWGGLFNTDQTGGKQGSQE